MFIKDTEQWAKETFGDADLGDNRRTKRWVKLSAQMAAHMGASVVEAAGDTASIEGALIGSLETRAWRLQILLKLALSRYYPAYVNRRLFWP